MPYRKGRRRKAHPKNQAAQEEVAEREKKHTPRCLVIKRGAVGSRVQDLVKDFREVMMPNVASRLRESKKNCLADFTAVAGVLRLSHLIIFTATKVNTWMKLVKMPEGPTLTFQVDSFTLARDVLAQHKKRFKSPKDLMVAPLQVLNGFVKANAAGVQDLTAETLRALFPAIDVATFNQGECRRTTLFHRDRETDQIHFRQFHIARRPVVQKGIYKLLKTAKVPKLGHCQDIADFVLSGGAGASETEVEGLEEVPIARANMGRTAVRLHEVGPRLSLLLVKVEEGVCNGTVMYHRFKTKLPSAEEVLQAKARERRKMRAQVAKAKAEATKQKEKRRQLEREKREREEAGEDSQDEPDYEKMAAVGGKKSKKKPRT